MFIMRTYAICFTVENIEMNKLCMFKIKLKFHYVVYHFKQSKTNLHDCNQYDSLLMVV